MNEIKKRVVTVLVLLPFRKDVMEISHPLLIAYESAFDGVLSQFEKDELTDDEKYQYIEILNQLTEEAASKIVENDVFKILERIAEETLSLSIEKNPEIVDKVTNMIEEKTFVSQKEQLMKEVEEQDQEAIRKIKESMGIN